MNDDRYYTRLLWAFVCFAVLQGCLVALTFFANILMDGPRSRWLEVTGGTLTFPTLAYAGMEVVPQDLKSPIYFRWWGRSAFEASPMVWVINPVSWAAFLAWAYCSSRKQGWMFGAALFLVALTFSFMCYSLYATIEYPTKWRDFISVFGTLATLLAFAIAIKQVGDAKHAAQATEVAIKETANVYGSHYFVYAISEAKRLFSLARSQQGEARQGNAQRWPLAAEYFRMTGEILQSAHAVSPPKVASEIERVVNMLREHSSECERMGSAGQNFKQAKWGTLEHEFSKLILAILQPIPQEVPHAIHQ